MIGKLTICVLIFFLLFLYTRTDLTHRSIIYRSIKIYLSSNFIGYKMSAEVWGPPIRAAFAHRALKSPSGRRLLRLPGRSTGTANRYNALEAP